MIVKLAVPNKRWSNKWAGWNIGTNQISRGGGGGGGGGRNKCISVRDGWKFL